MSRPIKRFNKFVQRERMKQIPDEINNKMKTPQQIKNEVKKGCGKVTNWYELKRLCGTFEDLKHSEHIILCPSCQAKLSILTEYDKSIKEMIEDLSNIEFMGVSGNQARKLIQEELLSKIGDDSDNSQENLSKDNPAPLDTLRGSKIGDVQQSKEKRNEK